MKREINMRDREIQLNRDLEDDYHRNYKRQRNKIPCARCGKVKNVKRLFQGFGEYEGKPLCHSCCVKQTKIEYPEKANAVYSRISDKLALSFIFCFFATIIITMICIQKKEIDYQKLFKTSSFIYIFAFGLISFLSGVLAEKLLKNNSNCLKIFVNLLFAFQITVVGLVYEMEDLTNTHWLFLLCGLILFIVNVICMGLNSKYKTKNNKFKLIIVAIPVTLVLVYSIAMIIYYYA